MLEIEITQVNEINGGVEVFARAWRDGTQIGFGKDGTVDIERFRFFNPPVLVRDDNGDIIREGTHPETGETVTTIYREDPEEAIIQAIERTIASMKNKHDASAIIVGKRGNTTSTIYSDSGDGFVGYTTSSSWSTTRGAATGTSASHTGSTVTDRGAGSYFSGSTYKIYRDFYSFDTSAIGGDTIDSATFTIYAKESTNSAGVGTVELVEGTQASTTSLATSDYNAIGSTIYAPHVAIADSTQSDRTWTLNATGEAAINGSGTTKMSLRTSLDLDNTTPVDTTLETNVLVAHSDYTGTTEDPVLVVEHTAGGGGTNEVKSVAGISNV